MAHASGSWEGLFRYATSDAQVIGVLTWVGLIVTVAGFWVAILQIRKVRKASDAANEAVLKLAKIVRSQEQSVRITNALAHITSAQTMMSQKNPEAAIAYLSVGWNALLSAMELSEHAMDRGEIERYIVSTRRLLDDMTAPGGKASLTSQTSIERHAEISAVIGGLGVLSARLNAALSGIGTKP